MKKNDQEIQKRYLEKLARARTTRDLVNPDESILEKQSRIRRAKEDVATSFLPTFRIMPHPKAHLSR